MVLQDQKSGYTFSLKKKSLLGNQGQIIQNVSVYIPYLKKKKVPYNALHTQKYL